MKQLDAARGAEFDRLFLTFMIQHHQGAVHDGEGAVRHHGAGQDETVFKFASDVNVDQTTEIDRMQTMLARLAAAPLPTTASSYQVTSVYPLMESLMASVTCPASRIRMLAFGRRSAVALVRGVNARGSATVPRDPARRPRPSPDPRVGLQGRLMDAGEAVWNLKLVSNDAARRRSSSAVTNSDLAFTGNYAIQGNYNGYQVWDISNPAQPDADDGVRLPGVAERRVGLQEPAVRVRRGITAAARLRRAGRARTR